MKTSTQCYLFFILGFFTLSNITFGADYSHTQTHTSRDRPSARGTKKQLIRAINYGTVEDIEKVLSRIRDKKSITLLRDHNGDVLLHWMARNRGSEQVLYSHFFDSKYMSPYTQRMLVVQRNKEGLTPRELAEQLQNTEMLKALSSLEKTMRPIEYDFQDLLQAVKYEKLEEYLKILRSEITSLKSNGINYKISEISYTEDEEGNNIFHHFAIVKALNPEFNKELLGLMAIVILNYTHNLSQALMQRNKNGRTPLDLALEVDNAATFQILLKGDEFYKDIEDDQFSKKSNKPMKEELERLAKQTLSGDDYFLDEESYKPKDFLDNTEKQWLIGDQKGVLRMFKDLADKPKDEIIETLKLRNEKGNTVLHFVAEATISHYRFMNLVQEFQRQSHVPSMYNNFLSVKNEEGYTPIDINKVKKAQCRDNFNEKNKFSKKRAKNKRQSRRRV